MNNVLSIAERLYVDAVGELAAAEQAEAEAFLVHKNSTKPVRSDWEARALAVLETNAGVTQARGAVEIALNRLRNDSDTMMLEGTDAPELD